MKQILTNKILLISSLGHALTHFFIMLLPVLALPIAHDFGMSFGQVVSLSVLATILFGVGSLPAGWLADRWSHQGMMVIFFIGLGLAGIMAGLATTPLELMITLSLIGLFASIYHPVGTAWLLDAIASQKGKALGINSWAGNLGVAATAIVAGFLSEFFSWRAVFIMPGLLSIIMGVILLVVIHKKTNGTKKAAIKPTIAEAPSRKAHPQALVILTILMIASGLVYQALTTAFPSMLFEKFQTPFSQLDLTTGFWISLAYIIAGSAHLLGGHLIDRYSAKWVYLMFYTLQVPILLMATAFTSMSFWVVMTMSLFLHLGSTPAEKMMITDFAPKNRRATTLGTRFMIGVGIGALGTPLVGYIHDISGGFYWVLITIGVLAGIIAAVSLLLPEREPIKTEMKTVA